MEKDRPQPSGPVAFSDTDPSARYDDVFYDFAPDRLRSVQREPHRFRFLAHNRLCLEIEIVAADLLRFRYAVDGLFQPDQSYAVDPAFQASPPQEAGWRELEDHFEIDTGELRCRIDKERLLVSVYDREGRLINRDGGGFSARRTILQGTTDLRVEKECREDELFFGMGDKPGPLNLRGQQLENWNTDAFSYGAATDPLYKSIPFFFGLSGGQAYGIFVDNPHRSRFDFAATDPQTVSWNLSGGEMNYYLLYGPSLLRVAQRYHDLTGKPALPPLWSLGFQQCRWSYYPEERVREVCREFRERRIPCDAIYLDIDYMDGYRCFTWDRHHFPQPAQMISDLRKQGFQTVVMIDPGIKVDPDYRVYREGLRHDYFCRRTDGELMTGPVWPQACVFPDFTNPEVRKWWGDLYRDLYLEQGVAGFWNDMNEPAVFLVNRKTFPDGVRHAFDGHSTDHRRAHNVYGQQMSRATREGLQRLAPSRRPLVITRATYSGGQRHAWVWTGDNTASWEHLRIASRQCQRLSISGFSFVGSDIGGFAGQPDGELFVRWMQLAAFHPFFRVHSMGNNVDGAGEVMGDLIQQQEKAHRIDQEPWSFGPEFEAQAREAIELRYRLLPYLYTAVWENHELGLPVLRSLIFADQSDLKLAEYEEAFMCGEHLLVWPIGEAGLGETQIYLPQGGWYDYWTGEQLKGGQSIGREVDAGQIPLFVRAGAILPHYPVQQHVFEKKIELLSLKVYFSEAPVESSHYADAGEGLGYLKGEFQLSRFRQGVENRRWHLKQAREGNYRPSWSQCELILWGLPAGLAESRVDGRIAPLSALADGSYRLTVPVDFQEVELELSGDLRE